MLDLLILAVVLGGTPPATPSPSPSPSSSPEPVLHEIAHVRSSRCADMVTHANAAIAMALHNDDTLAQTIHELQNTKIDGNTIERRNALEALGNYAKQLVEQARAGDNEVKRLRAIANKSTNPEGKAELLAFANWLGGAMWRQQKVGRDLNGFLAAMDAKDMATIDESQAHLYQGLFSQSDPRTSQGFEINTVGSLTATGPKPPPENYAGPLYPVPSDYDMAQYAARDFQLRIPAIENDEAMASNHIIGATGGC